MVHMRPHTLLAAASLLRFAVAADADVTVVKTVTNTHTVCPLTTLLPTTCGPYPTKDPGANDKLPNEAEMSDIYNSWISEHETVSKIDEVTKTWLDWSLSKPTDADSSTKSYTGSSSGKPGSSTTGKPDPSTTGYHTTGSYNGTKSTTTTTSGSTKPTGYFKCADAVEGKPQTQCNKEGDRSKWCDGKSLDTNVYKNDYRSGHVCKYDLTITNTTLSYDKGAVLSFAINGQSPGPVIECNWVQFLPSNTV